MHFLVLAESRLCVHHVGSTGLPAESGRRVVWWKMELWFGFWGVFMHINIAHFPWEEFLVHQEEEEDEEGSSAQQIGVPWSEAQQAAPKTHPKGRATP